MVESSNLPAKPQGMLSTAEIPLCNWSRHRQRVPHAEVTVLVFTHIICEVVSLMLSFCHLENPGGRFAEFLSFAFFLDKGDWFPRTGFTPVCKHSTTFHMATHSSSLFTKGCHKWVDVLIHLLWNTEKKISPQVGWAGGTTPWCAASGKGVGVRAEGEKRTWNRDIVTNPNVSMLWAGMKEINSIPARHSTRTQNVHFTKEIYSSFPRPGCYLQPALQTSL